MSETHIGWKPGKVPWCWQPKAALHRIRESLDAENAVASGLLVYVALTEIASDKRSHTFQTTHSFIAMRSGLSQRTVQARIKDLAEIGVLKFDVPKLRGPATYTLLTVEGKGEQQPLPRVTQPLHNDKQPLPCVTQRAKKASLPTSQEVPKNEIKKAKNFSKGEVALNSAKANTETRKLVELMDSCREILGDDEMKRPDCHRRWLDRAEKEPRHLESVLAETRQMKAAGKIKTTSAQFAEDYWKRTTP